MQEKQRWWCGERDTLSHNTVCCLAGTMVGMVGYPVTQHSVLPIPRTDSRDNGGNGEAPCHTTQCVAYTQDRQQGQWWEWWDTLSHNTVCCLYPGQTAGTMVGMVRHPVTQHSVLPIPRTDSRDNGGNGEAPCHTTLKQHITANLPPQNYVQQCSCMRTNSTTLYTHTTDSVLSLSLLHSHTLLIVCSLFHSHTILIVCSLSLSFTHTHYW